MWIWPNKKSIIAYLIVSLQLTVVFVALYGFCNWLASTHLHNYKLWMNWELSIPLIPPMIVFYLSLNLLTAVPLFTLEADQIRSLGKSMIVSTFVAAVFFLLLPAAVGFSRTADVGIWTPFFKTLFSLDNPTNTFPSLHITYSFLVVRSVSSVRLTSKAFLWSWFTLICASVLLVHQHHVIDIFGGIALGEVCFRTYFLDQKLWSGLFSKEPDSSL